MNAKLFDDFSLLPKEKQRINKLNQKPYKGLYRTFVSKKRRQKQLQQAELAHQEYLAQCWDRVISAYFAGELPNIEIKAKKQLDTQKIFWQYWGQGFDHNLPDVVKICFNSIDKYKDDYAVIRLDDSSIHDYLEIPDFILEKRNNPEFKHAFFSDIFRLALLKNYGGIWIDATILLTAPIDKDVKEKDFFMFQRDEKVDNQLFWQNFNINYFNWHKHHHVNVLNSFIVATKYNSVISHCLNILVNFWKYSNHIPHYFFFQIMYDILIHKYIPNENCQVIDDTLPHLLITKINEPYDEKVFNEILQKINIHKLTYVKDIKMGSYFEFFGKL